MTKCKTLIEKVERILMEALRTCCAATRSSPSNAVQVEMGEMPFNLRIIKLMLNFWVSIKGHYVNHHIKSAG